MKKVLVLTGMAGFIGMNLLKALVKEYNILHSYSDVISIDKMGYATKYNSLEYYKICDLNCIISIDENINDLNAPNVGNRLCYRPDRVKDVQYDVVSLASESHVDNSIKNPYGIFVENVNIPVNLVQWLGRENINKYVHISTDEVYGDLPVDCTYENWFDLNSPLHPNNPYSASKAAQDCFLLSLKHTFGLNLKMIRLANQFGPYQHPEKMLPATVLRAVQGQPIKIYGKGLNVRQWTPVVDSVNVIMDVISGKIEADLTHIANIVGAVNNNDVVQVWRDILEKDFRIYTTTEFVEDRKGHDLMYAIKTNVEVNKHFRTNETRFMETIAHYIMNKDNYLRKIQ